MVDGRPSIAPAPMPSRPTEGGSRTKRRAGPYVQMVIAATTAALITGFLLWAKYSNDATEHRLIYHPNNAIECATAEQRWDRQHPGTSPPVDCSRFGPS